MKQILIKSCMLMAVAALLASCKKFEEINTDPLAASPDQVQVEYFINRSIIQAQMDPDVAERSFVLYWKTAAHQQEDEGLSSGYYDDGWTTAYYNQVSDWLNSINAGIKLANDRLAASEEKPYTNNLLQVARIWRGYLQSEMSDIFGPIPVNGFQGVNPEYSDIKSVYYFILSELKDASDKLDLAVVNTDALKKEDPAYSFDYTKWKKFANSLRMRLAMRLSEVDAAKAKAEFEDAASGGVFITDNADMFQVAERGGWDALSGVMSREWNPQFLSATLNNTYIGLGGIKSADQVGPEMQSYIKPANWMGLKFDDHFSSKTNDPSAGYWFDGLYYTIDPRAYKNFIIPGDFSNPNFSGYPSWSNDAENTVRSLLNTDGTVLKTVDAKYTWNPSINGDWGTKASKNQLVTYYEGTVPRLSQQFRGSASKRVFFGAWETYFLLAEAAERGWSTPVAGKAAYELGITRSFEYWGLTPGSYLTSQDFNRTGTSVSWDHVAEPPASYPMDYKNGYTNAAGVATVIYPKNDLYKNGTVKNDHLTKIITQKFIAQCPWQPLEVWSDHRRLGLPFFENIAVEVPSPNIPTLTGANYMTGNVKFFPQRIKYPSSFRNSNAKGYEQAVGALGGADEVLTPLWWAMH